MCRCGVADAFDLTKENPKTVASYDTSHLFRMEDYHKGGKHYNNLVNQSRVSNLLGKQMLLARRLCEAGCGFVTVVDSCWDFHGDGNNPPTPVGMSFLGPQLDHAVAAFLEDIHQRGLSDKILLIITGEFGPTPVKDRKHGGTGHLDSLTPLVFAGGGLKMGQVIGESNRNGSAPATRRYTPENLLATVLHTLFDVGHFAPPRNPCPGTSAAWPSTIIRSRSCSDCLGEQTVVFKADHPFLFLIRENRTEQSLPGTAGHNLPAPNLQDGSADGQEGLPSFFRASGLSCDGWPGDAVAPSRSSSR